MTCWAAIELKGDFLSQWGQEGVLCEGQVQPASSAVLFPVISCMFF